MYVYVCGLCSCVGDHIVSCSTLFAFFSETGLLMNLELTAFPLSGWPASNNDDPVFILHHSGLTGMDIHIQCLKVLFRFLFVFILTNCACTQHSMMTVTSPLPLALSSSQLAPPHLGSHCELSYNSHAILKRQHRIPLPCPVSPSSFFPFALLCCSLDLRWSGISVPL